MSDKPVQRKSPRGRKPKADPTRDRHVYIPQSIHDQVEEALADPVTGKAPKGSFSTLVTQLLREWLEGQGGNS